MKLSKKQLKEIIMEEIEEVLGEQVPKPAPMHPAHKKLVQYSVLAQRHGVDSKKLIQKDNISGIVIGYLFSLMKREGDPDKNIALQLAIAHIKKNGYQNLESIKGYPWRTKLAKQYVIGGFKEIKNLFKMSKKVKKLGKKVSRKHMEKTSPKINPFNAAKKDAEKEMRRRRAERKRALGFDD